MTQFICACSKLGNNDRYTVKPVFKTTWEIGTIWELRTVTSVPMPIQKWT